MNAILALVLAATPAGPQWLGPKLAGPAMRVVTLAPSLTETVLALDAGARLVGVSRYDDEAAVAGLPRVGGFNDPSVEAVLAVKPDLVLAAMAPGNQAPVRALGRLGLTVVALPLTSMADSVAAMELVGAALGLEKEGNALAARLRQAREAAQARAKMHGRQPRVLLVYGFSPLVVAGPGSFAHELLVDVGAENLAKKANSAYPMYSLERALRLRPEVVIDASDSDEGRARVRALEPMAVARWVSLPSKKLLRPGPGLADALVELERVLEP